MPDHHHVPISEDVLKSFREYLAKEHSGKPCVFVVFGASGDLAKKKIFPTLWWLFRDTVQPPTNFTIVGYARSSLTLSKLRALFEKNCKVSENDKEKFEEFMQKLIYVQGAYDLPEGFENLNTVINVINGYKPTNRVYYLALPPSVFEVVTVKIKEWLMGEGQGWVRVIVEKPFGRDSESSKELSNHLAKLFTEEQIYRIDHYLGKEMVQNLMVLRFGNRIFTPCWNRNNIDSVLISFKEDFGTFGRAGYFDTAGIIRDVMQNHLMQILTLVGMEKPASLKSKDIRDEKVKVLKAIRPLLETDIIVGQYVANPASKLPEADKGYKDDPEVPKDSITPTYALAKFEIHNDRWEGVPFFLRCGKALNEKKAEVRIVFKNVSGDIYPAGALKRNQLVLRVQPDEAVYTNMMVKKPGMGFDVEDADLDLTYSERWKDVRLPDAYERLIMDVLKGEMMNFVRTDELEHAWRIMTPILHELEEKKTKPVEYLFGSNGPPMATHVLRCHGYDEKDDYYPAADLTNCRPEDKN